MQHIQPLLVSLSHLLDGNIDQIGMAYAEVEPLVSDGTVGVNLNRIEKGTALSAIFIRGQRDSAVRRAGELKGPVPTLPGAEAVLPAPMRARRYSSPPNSAGRLGNGESAVNTTVAPTAWTAFQGQPAPQSP